MDHMRPRLLDGSVTTIGIGDVAECLRELRSTPFASLVQNGSLYEKLFLIAVAKEMAATGTTNTTLDAVCCRLSTMLPLIVPTMRDPVSVLERVRACFFFDVASPSLSLFLFLSLSLSLSVFCALLFITADREPRFGRVSATP